LTTIIQSGKIKVWSERETQGDREMNDNNGQPVTKDYCEECGAYVVASCLRDYGKCLGCVEAEQEAK
jgi:hypothetical protein